MHNEAEEVLKVFIILLKYKERMCLNKKEV